MNNFLQFLPYFMQNPERYLGKIDGVDMKNPNEIIQYGLNSGKFTQQQYNDAVKYLKQFGYKG